MSKREKFLYDARSELGGAIIKGITPAINAFQEKTHIEVEQIIINLKQKRIDIHYGKDRIFNQGLN